MNNIIAQLKSHSSALKLRGNLKVLCISYFEFFFHTARCFLAKKGPDCMEEKEKFSNKKR